MELNESWKRDGIFREPIKREFDKLSPTALKRAEVRAKVENKMILKEADEHTKEIWELEEYK